MNKYKPGSISRRFELGTTERKMTVPCEETRLEELIPDGRAMLNQAQEVREERDDNKNDLNTN